MVSCSFKQYIISALLSSFLPFFLGVVLMSIGGGLLTRSYSTVAISVPLFPETGDEFGLFAGATSSTGNLTVDFSLSELVMPDSTHDIYLVHNLWGYDISLSVIDGFGNSALAFDDSRNVEGSPEIEVARPTERWTVPEWARFGREMFVKCPAGSTLVTTAEDVEPSCLALGGALMPIGEHLEALWIGSLPCAILQPPATFVFHELIGLPMDFVQVPQMYIVSWKLTTSTFFIAGAVLLPLGVVVFAFHTYAIIGRINVVRGG
jgi:hypothetical protein